MLSDESFLRKIPQALSLEQRLPLETMSFAIDGIFWSFARLKEISFGLANVTDLKFDRAKEHGLFAYGWSIVDQCHILRMLLSQLPLKVGGITEAFVRDYEQVTLMRNAMDHLPQRFGNIVQMKKPSPPIFGVMCFCVIAEEDIVRKSDGSQTLKGCTSIAVTAGSLTHRNHRWELQNPAGKAIEFPVGAFEFQAFDYNLPISQMMADLTKVVEGLDSNLRSAVTSAIRDAAEVAGLDPEKLLNEYSGGYRTAARFSFVDSTAP